MFKIFLHLDFLWRWNGVVPISTVAQKSATRELGRVPPFQKLVKEDGHRQQHLQKLDQLAE